MHVGALHTDQSNWMNASLSFMRSGGYSITDRISELQCPALVIWGKDDQILSPDYAKRFSEDIKDSRISLIENSGHVPHLEKPRQVLEQIENFLIEKEK